MKDILIEHTRKEKKRHFFVRVFVPVFQRLGECYSREKGFYIGFIYAEDFWWSEATPTSIPKKMWPIQRIRKQRKGQLSLCLI